MRNTQKHESEGFISNCCASVRFKNTVSASCTWTNNWKRTTNNGYTKIQRVKHKGNQVQCSWDLLRNRFRRSNSFSVALLLFAVRINFLFTFVFPNWWFCRSLFLWKVLENYHRWRMHLCRWKRLDDLSLYWCWVKEKALPCQNSRKPCWTRLKNAKTSGILSKKEATSRWPKSQWTLGKRLERERFACLLPVSVGSRIPQN